MTTATESILPYPGRVLHRLIVASGYLPVFRHLRMIGDLEVVKRAAVLEATAGKLARLEQVFVGLLLQDCGQHWRNFFESRWKITAELFRLFAREVDTTRFPSDGTEKVDAIVIVPLLGEIMCALLDEGPAPRPDPFESCERPIEAWLALVARRLALPIDEVADRLATVLSLEKSTVRRWRSGGRCELRAHCPPGTKGGGAVLHRATVRGIDYERAMSPGTAEHLTGWLVVAIAVQSLSASRRQGVKVAVERGARVNWTPEGALRKLATIGFDCDRVGATAQLIADDRAVHRLSPDRLPPYVQQANEILADAGLPHHLRCSLSLVRDRFSIRIAIAEGRDDDAKALLERAIEEAWWMAGWQQEPLLEEGLLFAVGTGRRRLANQCLSYQRLLSTSWEDHPETLDEQERRRVSWAFEARYPTRKAEERIPPPLRVELCEASYEPSRQDLRQPNALSKHAGGRTRDTSLMEAVNRGTVADVARLLAAGGDPNVYVPESGESALTWAIRRAERDEPGSLAILALLFERGVSADTLDRAASSERTRPLDIAVETGRPALVTYLLSQGTDVSPAHAHPPIARCPPPGIELPLERPYPPPVRLEGAVEPIGPLAGLVARALEPRRPGERLELVRTRPEYVVVAA